MQPSCYDALATYDQVAILMTLASLTNYGSTKADVEFCNASDQPIEKLATQLIIGYSCHRSTTVLRKSPIDILHNVSILLSPSTIPCGAPLAHSPNASGIISSSPYLPIDSPGVILPTAVVLPTMHGSNHPMMTRSKTSTTAPKHYTLTPRNLEKENTEVPAKNQELQGKLDLLSNNVHSAQDQDHIDDLTREQNRDPEQSTRRKEKRPIRSQLDPPIIDLNELISVTDAGANPANPLTPYRIQRDSIQ
ncbi:hypothetical protein LWI28_005980 [Acer negundo]|uniref:Uncharacterized protein n=1 Tax=Acer negundo TaxID=4023 RepID=A0AAD5J2Z5_ACENE|nr:hypothetical protein LWI28_005980 [Acer negundo]